jgi:hypothetical protein
VFFWDRVQHMMKLFFVSVWVFSFSKCISYVCFIH